MKDKSETYRLHIGNNRRRSFTPNPTFILPSIACPMQLYIGFPQIYSKQTQMRQKNAMDQPQMHTEDAQNLHTK